MYWNELIRKILMQWTWLTLTWDVLKWKIREQSGLTQQRLTLTWDVLKYSSTELTKRLNRINMRCIEMKYSILYDLIFQRLTLTWDVLKYVICIFFFNFNWININMRCIEMFNQLLSRYCCILININMRCIEMLGVDNYVQPSRD